MEWSVARARRHFSQLLKQAAEEPQVITNRDRPIAAVVDRETFDRFQAWQRRQRRSLFDAFAELREICEQEDYQLPGVPRADRPNLFPRALDELSG